MDRDKLTATLHRLNPRNLPFAKPMPSEVPPQKPPASIIDRFRAFLKLRDDEGLSPPGAGEIVRIYEALLSELTFNSKPVITDLTIIAGEQKEHGEGIADAICARIIEAPIDQKLPSLYLLDSIVKNIGGEYIRHFSSRLPEVFCEAYRQVDPSMYGSMRHLFGTWSIVFSPQVLRKIESELRFSAPDRNKQGVVTALRSAESPIPSHGIHVNPKYVRPLEHSALDSGQYIGPSHSLITEKISSRGGPERPFTSEVDGISIRSSPRKFEKSSPSRPAYEYGHEILVSGRKHSSEDARYRLEAPGTSSTINGREHQNLRALIDAYGNDDRETSLSARPFPVDRSVDSKVTMSWQDTEEQEFDWEDMSPTLADGTRRVEAMPFARDRVPAEADSHRKWSRQPRLPYADESTHSAGDAIASLDGDQGLMKLSVIRETNQGYSQERTFADNLSQTSRHGVNRGTIRNFATAFATSEDSLNAEAPFANPPSSLDMFPSIAIPPVMHSRGSFNSTVANTLRERDANQPSFIPEQFDNSENRDMILSNSAVFANKQPSLLSMQQSNQVQVTPLPPQFLQPHVRASYHGQAPPLNYPSIPQGPVRAMPPALLNRLPNQHHPLPNSNIPSSSLHIPRGPMPLTLGPHFQSFPPLAISQGVGNVVSNQVSGDALAGLMNLSTSGLISSLMDKGLISLQGSAQDSVGLEFDVDHLKIRHESAIRALYSDLPRQCKTCGLRFRSQDEHSSHMDWHVTKNRTAKNRKHKSSRKWFVSTSMWLSGAEALGAEAVPGFLPTETIEEKKSDEEMSVPADEDQNACALCGESFDDFFCDETEEWMYKGAVYLNAPPGSSTAGLDRSHLGPIVHAKCRSESSVATPEISGHEGVSFEEGNRRKRLRS